MMVDGWWVLVQTQTGETQNLRSYTGSWGEFFPREWLTINSELRKAASFPQGRVGRPLLTTPHTLFTLVSPVP